MDRVGEAVRRYWIHFMANGGMAGLGLAMPVH